MMRTIPAVLLMSRLATPAAATVIQVPVPGLQGTYTSVPPSAGAFERTVTVQLPAVPSAIHSVSLHLKGTSAFANYSCDGSGGYGPPSPVPVNIGSELSDGNQYAYWEQYRDAPGAFDVTVTYGHYPEPVNWSFLLDGTASLRLGAWGVPPIFECNLVGDPDQTTFDEVTLIVDGEFPTAATASSWGHVKSTYR
jgi:hypothetical protein